MTSSRRLAFAAIVSIVGIACATSTAPLGGGGTGKTRDGGLGEGGAAYGGDDSGSAPGDGGLVHPPKDGGTGPVDSGTGPKDSGVIVTGSFCTGETSGHKNDFGTKLYDDWCDENSQVGVDFTCTSNSDCTGHFTSSYEPECCYQPIAGGYCESDYGGGAQCVPK